MSKPRSCAALVALGLILAACAGPPKKPLVDPFPLQFPLVEVAGLEIEGAVVGQPAARDGVVYYATDDGHLTAAVVPGCDILWRFDAGRPFSGGPELGQDHIAVRDSAGTLYLLDKRGSLVFKSDLGPDLTTAVREDRGMIFFGTGDGRIAMLDPAAGGRVVWESRLEAPVSAGPGFAGDLVLFGTGDGRLLAVDRSGATVWAFSADGTVSADVAVDADRLFFGTENRRFYCLNAKKGKTVWSRRLQGAPVHPAVVQDGTLALPASNSVVYVLSRRGGSILSWETVPSRVLFPLSFAAPSVLVTSMDASIVAFDISAGRRVGQHVAPGPLVAGAIWVPPFTVAFIEAQETGRQRMVVFRSR